MKKHTLFLSFLLSACLLLSGCGYSEKDLSAAKDAAYSAGYSEAEATHKLDYENGYSAAEDEHKNDYDNGYQDGYNAAEKELYESRYDDGYSDGYGEGYQDGAASADQSSYTYQFTPSTSSAPAPSSASTSASYIANTSTYKFHKPSCSSVKQMNESNKWYYTGTRDDLIAKGYDPCGHCHP